MRMDKMNAKTHTHFQAHTHTHTHTLTCTHAHTPLSLSHTHTHANTSFLSTRNARKSSPRFNIKRFCVSPHYFEQMCVCVCMRECESGRRKYDKMEFFHLNSSSKKAGGFSWPRAVYLNVALFYFFLQVKII